MTPRVCDCGCGAFVPAGQKSARSAPHQAVSLRGHFWRGREKSEAHCRNLGRARVANLMVPAAPVMKLLRDRGIGPTAAAKMLGTSKGCMDNLYYHYREYMMRDTAERILAALAGLPRKPSPQQRRDTSRRLAAADLKRKAQQKAEQRARAC